MWAYGPIAEKVKGQIDNTRIATASAEELGVDLQEATANLQAKHLYPKFKINRSNEVLYPAKALTEALGGKYQIANGIATVSGKGGTVTVDLNAKKAKLNGKDSSISVDIDNDVLYLPLTAFSQVSGQPLKWDALSERIVLK